MGSPQAFLFVDVGDKESDGVGADVDGTDSYGSLRRVRNGGRPPTEALTRAGPAVDSAMERNGAYGSVFVKTETIIPS